MSATAPIAARAPVARALGVTTMAIWRGLARGRASLSDRGLNLERVALKAPRQVD